MSTNLVQDPLCPGHYNKTLNEHEPGAGSSISRTLAGRTELDSFTREQPRHTPLSSVVFLYDMAPSPDLSSFLYSPCGGVTSREVVQCHVRWFNVT